MFRAKPIACKLTAQRYDEHCQQLHQRRLQTIKCSVDNKPPRRHDHVYRNLKREVLLEGTPSVVLLPAGGSACPAVDMTLLRVAERFSQIEHENRLLLKKVSGIMAKASVDNVNTSSKFAHSLNAGVRMQERERICRENEVGRAAQRGALPGLCADAFNCVRGGLQAMLKRLQEKPPHYSHAQWDTERKQAEKLLSSICEFPPIFVKKPRHPDRLPRIDSAQEVRPGMPHVPILGR